MKITYILLSTMVFFPIMSQDLQESVHQIDMHVTYLRSLYHKHGSYEKNVYPQQDIRRELVSSSYAYFKHPQLVDCIKDIQQSKSLAPFFTFWDTIKHDAHTDEALLEECALLSISFFNNILDELPDESRSFDTTEITVDEIIALYHRLATMPLTELIMLLTNIAQCVIEVIESTPLGHVLFTWLHISWWEPALAMSSFVFSWLTSKSYMQGDSPSYISVVY